MGGAACGTSPSHPAAPRTPPTQVIANAAAAAVPTTVGLAPGSLTPATTQVVHPRVNSQCPTGYYVNMMGQVECSTYHAPPPPPGAIAKCKDGAYSYARKRARACTHDGGVAEWL